MQFDRTGFILYVLNFQECVDFYKNILELPILYITPDLTCFQFGNAYLMVEIDDEADLSNIVEGNRTKTCLRMNVPDVYALVDKLKTMNIEVNLQEREWGTVAKFFDPDGNLCAFRDSEKFELQVENHQSQA